MKRDLQRQRVYDWENTNIAHHDRTRIPFEQIKIIVDYVWANEGLQFPPMVVPIPTQNHNEGDSTRIIVRFKETTYTWIILHELAHALSAQADGRNNAHGALFMGLYCQLLSKYLKMDFDTLVKSARDFGLRVKADAIPVFLDSTLL